MKQISDLFEGTEFKRAGYADGECMRRGCGRPVPATNSNQFYCTELCGRLANPETFGATREEDLRQDRMVTCPRCHGEGRVDP